MTTKAVVFDLGNVLDIQDDPGPWLARRERMAGHLGLTGHALWELFYHSESWELVKRGKITNPEYWDRVLSPLGLTDRKAQTAFVAELFEGRDQIHPSMRDLLHQLKSHYRLGLLSNTYEPDLETWLENRDLGEIFDVVVSSAKVGLAKPEPAIYRLTLERLGLPPEEVLFVDDLNRNTLAAEALGIHCIVFQSPAQLRAELKRRGILVEQASKP